MIFHTYVRTFMRRKEDFEAFSLKENDAYGPVANKAQERAL